MLDENKIGIDRGEVSSLAAWTTPTVKRMQAGDAEDGYDPIVPDAGITKS